jgi:hypothetical protein
MRVTAHTRTHKYVIFITFPRESASVLRHMYITCRYFQYQATFVPLRIFSCATDGEKFITQSLGFQESLHSVVLVHIFNKLFLFHEYYLLLFIIL